MVNLTFGEQVKVILSRKGMTIKELAEQVELFTGKPMSRQNMTQRLGRDNFQEQDMRMIAEILGCQFTLSIMEPMDEASMEIQQAEEVFSEETERDITVEELAETRAEDSLPVETEVESAERVALRKGVRGYFKKMVPQGEKVDATGNINPYTQKEYESNSVRMHPTRIGYVQVYDREQHKWADMTEWAFLGYQERKKKLLGKDYKPPIYLD